MKKISKVSSAWLGAALMSVSTLSWSGLYVYPVSASNKVASNYSLERDVSQHTSHSAEYYRSLNPDLNHEFYRSKEGSVGELVDATINETVSPSISLPCYGKDVPIEIALKNIFKEVDIINISPRVAGNRISWSINQGECRNVDDIVKSVNFENDLFVVLGEDKRSVGVGLNAREAKYYSYEKPKVWVSDSTKSIKENLTIWAESEGWNVVWPQIMNEFDFEAAQTVLYGDLTGKNGVFHRVLKQIASTHPNTQLSVEFWGNNYIVVKEGGYTNDYEGAGQ